MKKTFFISIIFAALIITSCSKKESTISNTNMSDDNSTALNIPYFGESSACYYWRDDIYSSDSCINSTPLSELCYITVGCTDDNTYPIVWEIDPVTHQLGSLRIPIASLPGELEQWFNQQIATGTITFHYDCPIDDPDLLAVSSTDYIPEGTYPFSSSYEYFIISLI